MFDCKLCLFIFSLLSLIAQINARHDVNVVGLIGTESTAPLIGATITDVLKVYFSVNLICSRPYLKNEAIQGTFKQDLPFDPRLISLNSTDLAPISILTDVISYKNNYFYKNVPETKIKLAYSMFEADKLPSQWVLALNKYFDAVVVPDKTLVGIYKGSGVKIPIFVINLPVYLEAMLAKPPKSKASHPFVFGVSAGFTPRKNYNVLLEAFAYEFKNDPNVVLKIHGSWGDSQRVKDKIKRLGLTNVHLMAEVLTRGQYTEFMRSLDCYVYLSVGEGYSLTPREAIALGIPCILSYHTVHMMMGGLKSVVKVPASSCIRAYFPEMGEYCGCFHQCSISGVRKALREVYTNYPSYLAKAQLARVWAEQFLRSRLAPKFKTLISPSNIKLGKSNLILNNQLITNSPLLYKKYAQVLSQSQKHKKRKRNLS